MAPPGTAAMAVGDPMPRIVLAQASGGTFDSSHQGNAGRIQIYWLDVPPTPEGAAELVDALPAGEAEMRLVARQAPGAANGHFPCLIDPRGDLARMVQASGPVAVVVDGRGQLAALLAGPTAHAIATVVRQLLAATDRVVVQAQAPVLFVDHAIDASLCTALIDHWQRGTKLADGVASGAGASTADADTKRRQDVPVNDAGLFAALRDSLVRRVMPAILQAFQSRIVQIELPRVGCYDAQSGGWFRRHRDNTTPYTAHRQFALSLNLNPTDEYEGGEVRFPEYGQQLYRPNAGGALVFSCSLLHEAVPVNRGRRFGVFTFLHDESRDAQYRRMMAEQQARGLAGVQMKGPP